MTFVVALFSFLKGIAWPAVVTFLALKFKPELLSWLPEIRALLPRVQEIGPTGVKLLPAEQQKEAEGKAIPKPGELRPGTEMQRSPAARILEQPLRNALAAIDEEQKTNALVAALAQARLEAGHERVYRLIFGSQILGLRQLNVAGRATFEDARAFFESITSQYKEFYIGYGFDGWLSFLQNNNLVQTTAGMLEITEIGRDFLQYLTAYRLPELKAG